MNREIIHIDEGKCNGCGLCIPNCHEGALQIIDDKAVLVSELMCDGLGACLGHCPQGALTIETREARPYDEALVMQEMIGKGRNVVAAHMKHLKDHREDSLLKQGVLYLMENKEKLDFNPVELIQQVHNHGRPRSLTRNHQNQEAAHEQGFTGQESFVGPATGILMDPEVAETGTACGCPGSREMSFGHGDQPGAGMESGNSVQSPAEEGGKEQPSALRQWPVQLHLVNPGAGYFQGADLLVTADCVAYALGNFHTKYLKNKSLVIACPKLDGRQEIYLNKLVAMIDQSQVNTITVMIMEVPCCGGLLELVQSAAEQAGRKIPVKFIEVGIQGQIMAEEWV